MEQRDFFISYSNFNQAWALWMADALKADGYAVYGQWDILAGDDFLDKMNEFLENSTNFIAVWSKDYAQSRFCMAEFRGAFHEWNKTHMERFLIIRVDDYPVKPLYASLVNVRLSARNEAEKQRLLGAVRSAVPHTDPYSNLSSDELYHMGEHYRSANDYIKAREYYEQAVAKGNAESLLKIGSLYELGEGVKKDYARAKDYYEQAAGKGNSIALNRLGMFYFFGDGVAQDYVKAKNYYEQAAIKGNAIAAYNLGVMYENGEGVTQNYGRALEWYQKAADFGNEDAYERVKELREKF